MITKTLPFFALLLTLSGCGGSEEKRDRPTPLVTTAAVTEHQFADRYAAVGNANANEQVSVRAPVTERITFSAGKCWQFLHRVRKQRHWQARRHG
jgi:membrane fusion protein, multidrug efflux system